MNSWISGLLRGFLQILTDGFDGFAGGFGGIFGAVPNALGNALRALAEGLARRLGGIPSTSGNSRSAFADRLSRPSGTLGHRLDSFTHGLSALPNRFAGSRRGIGGTFRRGLHAFAHRLAGGFRRVPCTLGHGLGALGGCFDSFAGFLDSALHVLLGLVTRGQTESGRRDNDEVRFHSTVTVKNGNDRGNHIFAKTPSEAQNTGARACILDTGIPRWFFCTSIAAKS